MQLRRRDGQTWIRHSRRVYDPRRWVTETPTTSHHLKPPEQAAHRKRFGNSQSPLFIPESMPTQQLHGLIRDQERHLGCILCDQPDFERPKISCPKSVDHRKA